MGWTELDTCYNCISNSWGEYQSAGKLQGLMCKSGDTEVKSTDSDPLNGGTPIQVTCMRG